MYRQYEDPYKLEKELEDWLEQHPDKSTWDEYDYENYQNLKDRINFAWQDDEYESNYMRENYPEDYIYDSESTDGKESVEAGLVSTILNTGAKLFDTFLKYLNKTFDKVLTEDTVEKIRTDGKDGKEVKLDSGWDYMEVLTAGDYTDDQKKKGNYPYIFGIKLVGCSDDYAIIDCALRRKEDDNSKAVVDKAVKLSLSEDIDVSELTNEEFAKLVEKTVNDTIDDEMVKLFEKLGVVETVEDTQPIQLSTNIKVTLQKVVANDVMDIQLVAIDSPCNVTDTTELVSNIVENPDFVDSLPENEPASYSVEMNGDDYDIVPCDYFEVSMDTCIDDILRTLYNLSLDCLWTSWNVTGSNYTSIKTIADSYMWMSNGLIDQLSVEHYKLFGYAPHPMKLADVVDRDNVESVLDILREDIATIICTIDLYYCNFDGTIQQCLLQAKDSFETELAYTLARFK